MLTYRRLTEFGSLEPIPARSVYPGFLFSRFRTDQPARLLLLASILLGVVLFVVVAAGVATRQQVALRFTAQGLPGDYVSAVRLFLLPVLNTLFLLADGFVGLFFYRRPELQPLSYLVWGTSLVTAGLFLGAAVFILSYG